VLGSGTLFSRKQSLQNPLQSLVKLVRCAQRHKQAERTGVVHVSDLMNFVCKECINVAVMRCVSVCAMAMVVEKRKNEMRRVNFYRLAQKGVK
jgi:hypothetical protein